MKITLTGASGFIGGVLRSGLTIAQIRALLEIRSDKDPSLITEIETYMSQQALRDEGAPH